jgi:hypothetical protein
MRGGVAVSPETAVGLSSDMAIAKAVIRPGSDKTVAVM